MRLPWQQPKIEKRASYGQQLINALHSAALGDAADVAATSPVVAIAGLLATLPISRYGDAADAAYSGYQSNSTYTAVGESIVYRGESVALIEVEDGAVRLIPAAEWDISGKSTKQNEWRYKLCYQCSKRPNLEDCQRGIKLSTSEFLASILGRVRVH